MKINFKKFDEFSGTIKRIKEAKYFLSQLDTFNCTIEILGFYLNAFINSCRSVTWILKNESTKIDKGLEIYDREHGTKYELKIMEIFTDLRNYSQKIRPLEFRKIAQISIEKILSIDFYNKNEYEIMKLVDSLDFDDIFEIYDDGFCLSDVFIECLEEKLNYDIQNIFQNSNKIAPYEEALGINHDNYHITLEFCHKYLEILTNLFNRICDKLYS